jgi:dTDP-4-amino-4,6-dideoxy-D-galactose acyltransferase
MSTSPQQDAEQDAPCELLGWDSEFFGVETARVKGDSLTSGRVEEIDRWCKENKIKWLYFLARSDDAETVKCAERSGFELVDVRVTYDRSVADVDWPVSNVKAYTTADWPAISDIAYASYVDSRFYYDGGIPRDTCDRLYHFWTAQSCGGNAGHQAWVARDEAGTPTGYVICHADTNPGWGKIGLIGVDRAARGKGVGARLVQAALGWAKNQGLASMTVVTQGRNIAAQRLYQRCGFMLRAQQLYYHKWYE